jgi:hypothetical protein
MADLETKLDAALKVIAPKPLAKKTPGGYKWHYFPIANPLTHKQDIANWKLIVKWQHYQSWRERQQKLGAQHYEEMNRAVWDLNDAYGAPGTVPYAQWDWSGIRDSSTAVKRKMAGVIRKLLKKWGVRA